jgi:hypothetical protein
METSRVGSDDVHGYIDLGNVWSQVSPKSVVVLMLREESVFSQVFDFVGTIEAVYDEAIEREARSTSSHKMGSILVDDARQSIIAM